VNIFFSGIGGKGMEHDPRLAGRKRYRLLSCHGAYKRSAYDISRECVDAGDPVEFMYDSGAFTAWSRGEEVHLDELIPVYGDLIKEFGSRATAIWLINLDKIPGSKGRTASPDEIERAIEISDQNYTKLVAEFGPCVLPVFHQNEDEVRLRQIHQMAEFICVSPRNDLPEGDRMSWSQETHRLLASYGEERRTHGLAATGWRMMHRVPWWSVDSATWVILGANGAVFTDTRLKIVQISALSGARKDADNHFRTMAPVVQETLAAQIAARGFTVEELEDDFRARMLYNRVILNESALVAAQSTRHNEVHVPSLFGL